MAPQKRSVKRVGGKAMASLKVTVGDSYTPLRPKSSIRDRLGHLIDPHTGEIVLTRGEMINEGVQEPDLRAILNQKRSMTAPPQEGPSDISTAHVERLPTAPTSVPQPVHPAMHPVVAGFTELVKAYTASMATLMDSASASSSGPVMPISYAPLPIPPSSIGEAEIEKTVGQTSEQRRPVFERLGPRNDGNTRPLYERLGPQGRATVHSRLGPLEAPTSQVHANPSSHTLNRRPQRKRAQARANLARDGNVESGSSNLPASNPTN